METALVGFLGVLIGLLINEHFRRQNRIETYSSSIFNKRLQIYEGLYSKVNDCSTIITDLIENQKYTKEERHDIVSDSVHVLGRYFDEYDFYINQQITVQCMTLMMGVEDIYYMENIDEKEEEIQHLWKHFRDAKSMIKKESGIEELDKLFKSITRAKHSSNIIDYFNTKYKKIRKRDKEL